MSFTAIKEYANDVLAPFISEETQEFHYGKHHIGYASTLNKLVDGTQYAELTLRQLIRLQDQLPDQKIWNNAAQVFNHDFYWKSLSKAETVPSKELSDAINASFGNMENFKASYIETASTMFGSGWSWLICSENSLSIVNTQNANIPAEKKLLVIDLWEHAYYIDYRNDRRTYIENIVGNCLNWNFASENFA